MGRAKQWIVGLTSLSAVASCSAAGGPVEVDKQTSAIIGGETETGYPHVGALVSGGRSFCSSALIRPGWVLTAAHCIDSQRPSGVSFFVGAVAGRQGNTYRAAQLYIHPRYELNPAAALHDIALIRLSTPVPANVATPIPFNEDPLEGEIGKVVTFVGYGVSDGMRRTGGGTKRRTSVAISRVDPISYSTGFAGLGVCFGDSGGPGLLDMGEGTEVISVNSTVNGCFGDNCDPCKGTGSNYTRVDVFADWIRSVIGEPFDKCNDSADRCDCPAACQPDGVCDDIVCVSDSCQTALDCFFDDCDGGNDGSCAQGCAQSASVVAQARLGDLMQCASDNCKDVMGAAANRACFNQNCKKELSACAAPAGAQGCAEAKACGDQCSAGDSACAKACADAATLDAQAALTNLISCQTSSCAGMTGSALELCLGQKCKPTFDACYPPHHCTVGASSCPAGQQCMMTASGSTQCMPVAVPPMPPPDAGVATPPAAPVDAGIESPVSPPAVSEDAGPPPNVEEPGDEDSGTTTISNPATGVPMASGNKSSGGCSVTAHGRAASGAWLTLALGLASLVAVRRRRGTL